MDLKRIVWMSIFDLFSNRLKKANGEGITDVYQYDNLSQKFRVQVVQIIEDTLGPYDDYNVYGRRIYQDIHRTLCKEYGVFSLVGNTRDAREEVLNKLLEDSPDYVEVCLNIIDLSFNKINSEVRRQQYQFTREIGTHQTADDAILELNYRFREAGIGYQFEAGELIKVDHYYIHSEVVKPVLHLLGKLEFYSRANNEFLSAHEHYRNKRYKECLNDCLKSFESLLKAIHVKRKWNYKSNATARKLIESCFDNGLLPSYLKNQQANFFELLVSGVPTVRNKEGGHGQGAEIKFVSEHLASYVLHLTAVNLRFIMECELQSS